LKKENEDMKELDLAVRRFKEELGNYKDIEVHHKDL
jgi:hypothetical protein